MNKHDQPPSFEDCYQKLQEIVRQLERGDLDLSQSLAQYEEGIGCLKRCHKELEKAEQRIQLLSGIDGDGNETCEDFDQEEAMSLEEKADSRSRRRSRKKPATKSGGRASQKSGEKLRSRGTGKGMDATESDSDDQLDDPPGLF